MLALRRGRQRSVRCWLHGRSLACFFLSGTHAETNMSILIVAHSGSDILIALRPRCHDVERVSQLLSVSIQEMLTEHVVEWVQTHNYVGMCRTLQLRSISVQKHHNSISVTVRVRLRGSFSACSGQTWLTTCVIRSLTCYAFPRSRIASVAAPAPIAATAANHEPQLRCTGTTR